MFQDYTPFDARRQTMGQNSAINELQEIIVRTHLVIDSCINAVLKMEVCYKTALYVSIFLTCSVNTALISNTLNPEIDLIGGVLKTVMHHG